MRIALDAKRAFHNATGLGNYSRNLIDGFQFSKSAHEFYLFTPKIKETIYQRSLDERFNVIENSSLIKPYWRSFSIAGDLDKNNIELYHGLSNEIPFTLEKKDIKKVVTIHDLIYLRFPNLYPILDRNIYFHKAKKSCLMANKVIATSMATKNDIIEKLGINEDKIEIVFQSCAEEFYKEQSEAEWKTIQAKYNLPSEYILCVGRLEERKNLRQVIQAVSAIPKQKRLPLLIVGRGKKYQLKLAAIAKELEVDAHFEYQITNDELPNVYQHAALFLYTSFYEGFGIPVLEAMASKVPVITSKGTSMEEIISDPNCLVNPYNELEIADRIVAFLKNNNQTLIADNFKRAQTFSNVNFAKNTLKVYDSI